MYPCYPCKSCTFRSLYPSFLKKRKDFSWYLPEIFKQNLEILAKGRRYVKSNKYSKSSIGIKIEGDGKKGKSSGVFDI